MQRTMVIIRMFKDTGLVCFTTPYLTFCCSDHGEFGKKDIFTKMPDKVFTWKQHGRFIKKDIALSRLYK